MVNYFSPIYNTLWQLAIPLLRRSPRMGQCWNQRTLQQAPQGPFDIWIQAASGGEAALVVMVLNVLDKIIKKDKEGCTLRVLATATTPQGIEILKKNSLKKNNINLSISAFPLDAPSIMEKAFHHFQPDIAILVETELWPAFLVYAKKANIPVMIINGRMSNKSYRAYRKISSFFQRFGPQRVLAMSQEDAKRFGNLVGSQRVAIIPNLKFDAIPRPQEKTGDIQKILPANTPFLVFGSIRKEEEVQIINCIYQLLHKHPALSIALFPKHIERAEKIRQKTARLGIPCLLRSSLYTEPAPAGSVIIWDQFGEQAAAYQYAEAAFVGGSLCPRGGHNLIEPLVAGIRPVTGPCWHDFAWIGRRAQQLGFIEEVNNSKELTAAMLHRIEQKEDKKRNLLAIEKYLATKRGGTSATCKEIIRLLPEKS